MKIKISNKIAPDPLLSLENHVRSSIKGGGDDTTVKAIEEALFSDDIKLQYEATKKIRELLTEVFFYESIYSFFIN